VSGGSSLERAARYIPPPLSLPHPVPCVVPALAHPPPSGVLPPPQQNSPLSLPPEGAPPVLLPGSAQDHLAPLLRPALPPHLMCTRAECADRGHGSAYPDISVFEATYPDAGPGRRRTIDPYLAVSRFRRPAAGLSSAELFYGGRSKAGLESAVQHLLQTVFVWRRATSEDDGRAAQTLADAASFVGDRMRSIQSERTSRRIRPPAGERAQAVRYYILVGYLLRSAKKNGWADKFNEAALAAALADVREEVNCGSDAADECGAYEVLRAATSENGLGAEAVAASWIRRDGLTNWPKVRWSLSWTAAVGRGEIASALRMLREGPQCCGADGVGKTEEGKDRQERWIILCRCCVAPMLQNMRTAALRQYNSTWAKRERVRTEEIAILLGLGSAGAAASLCKSLGLQIVLRAQSTQDDGWNGGRRITDSSEEYDCIFKTGNIVSMPPDGVAREDDDFVFFGSVGARGSRRAVDFLLDGDGVRVPPERLLLFMMA